MGGPAQILLVEDEAPIAETVLYALRTEGFESAWCTTGTDALALMRSRTFDLLILDVGLPDMNGLDLCREIRRGSRVPIIFLTSRGTEIDRIVGLELGADDYMAKPFSPRELTARVRAVLRRLQPMPSPAIATPPATGAWQHDADRCRITYGGTALSLTRNEYRLLATLIATPGRVFSREQLMTAAWDDPASAIDRTVDAHVKTIRAKLRAITPNDDPIVTHRGLGYSIREDA